MWSSSNCCGVIDICSCCTTSPSFEIICEVIISYDSIPSSSRFVINGLHCRHCGQGMLNWSDHTIVDDEFLFVKDGSIRLCECRIGGSHLLIHMISDSWTTQKENFQKFVWNTLIVSVHGLVYFHQNTKQIFVKSPVTKEAISLKQHQQFFGVHWPHPKNVYDKVISIKCIGFIQ